MESFLFNFYAAFEARHSHENISIFNRMNEDLISYTLFFSLTSYIGDTILERLKTFSSLQKSFFIVGKSLTRTIFYYD